ncbi:stemmadenine O-acetyltransferase-like [Andrographis paniculata]|uniref:stemmadenine O-acetyltransferase-like n=1 Tax=Andrographis paniculata TaxID=175694 RepID=UPI0021E94E2C|nr:stemmadenine O-acetyltransferase-like [Andrographis paniculata]
MNFSENISGCTGSDKYTDKTLLDVSEFLVHPKGGYYENLRIIVSSENIKPDSPTPPHLKTYKLSMLDQIHLKKSLLVLLTRFYPFAGRVNVDDNGHSIDCSDQGVHFTVAKFPGHNLSDLLENPDRTDLPSLLVPGVDFIWQEIDPESRVLMIQVNYFDCGGIAMGVVFWHKLADATTITNFLRSWGNANRGSKHGVCPNYISQYLFPHRPELTDHSHFPTRLQVSAKWALKRYRFRRLYNFSPSERIFLQRKKCYKASLENGKSESFVLLAVDLRRKARPPFPSDCFGNFLSSTVAASGNHDRTDLTRKLRDAISRIDETSVTSLQGHGDGGLESFYRNRSLTPKASDVLVISSLCGFGTYGLDFGWGNPVWIAPRCDTSSDFKSKSLQMAHSVWLMDTRLGHGVEALVTLKEEYMPVFDRAMNELRDLATLYYRRILKMRLDLGIGEKKHDGKGSEAKEMKACVDIGRAEEVIGDA